MAFEIDQPAGAGAGSPSLDYAWIGVPVLLAALEGTAQVLDKSDGLEYALSATSNGEATLNTSGIPGAVRITDGVTVRVIGFTKSVSGVVLAPAAPPVLDEVPGERNGLRGYCHAWDEMWQSTREEIAALKARVDSLENP